MRITLGQLAIDLDEPRQARVERVCRWVASQWDADLVVLPELWSTGYFAFDRYADTAEPVDGPLVAALGEAARSAHVHLHAGSIVERAPDDRLFNTSLLLAPDGRVVHTQRKVHLFGHGSREPELLHPADAVDTYAAPFGVVGMTACYDLRFPELFRVLIHQGAQLLIVPAAWPAARIGHWSLLLRARAIENQCFVIGCNAAGFQAGVALGGHSAIVAPSGDAVVEAGAGGAELRATIDCADVLHARSEFPVLADRRLGVPDLPPVARAVT